MTRARYVSNPQAIDIPLTVSANLTANAVITVGNSSVNSVITSNTYSVGSNVSLSTSRLFLGNSTVNSVHTASTLDVGANVNLSTVGLNVGSNTVNAYINSTSFAIGNSTVNTAITSTTITSTALLSIGNTNVTGTANVSTAINVGANVNLGTSFMDVGNSTVNTTITNITVSTNTVNVASIINVGANVNLSTSQINIGNTTVNTTISATALTTTSNTVSIGTSAYFVANGNVGIGTNSPTVKLQINQSSSTVGLRILSTNATSQNTLQMFHDDSKAVIEASYLASGAFKDIVMQSQGGNLLVNGTSQSGTANKVAVFSANKFGLSIIDTTAQANGVGGALNLGGNYRTSGDAQAFARIAAVKENSTDGNFAYGMTFSTTPNGGSFVEAARIDSSGNLGIGTSSPSVKFQTVQTIADWTGDFKNYTAGAYGLRVDLSGSSGDKAALQVYTATGNGIIVKNDGLVGIGTFSPTNKLTVDGQSGEANSSKAGANILVGTEYGLRQRNASAGISGLGYAAQIYSTASGGPLEVYTGTTNPLVFGTNSLERMRITSTGDVLVGLAAAASGSGNTQIVGKFRISGAASSTALFIQGNTDYAGLKIKVGDGDIAGGVAGYDFTVRPSYSNGVAGGGDVSAMYITTGYPRSVPDVAMLKDGGNFFIGKATDGNTVGLSYMQNMYGTGIGLLDFRGNSTSGDTTIMQAYRPNAGTYAFFVQWSGQIYAQSTSILSASDRSLKQNIRSLETGLSEIMALQPRRFDWIDGRAQNVAGFVAQEVQPYLPDLIESAKYSENEDGTTEYKLSIRMSDMIPTMVKAIQEQQALIAQLQADVAELKLNK